MDEFLKPGEAAILLTGSSARGDENPYSDVDLQRFVAANPKQTESVIGNGRLVSLSETTLEQARASLHHPEQSLWVAPGLRQGRILSDPTGALAQLQAAAEPPPKLDGRDWSRAAVRGWSEEAHKLLAALSSHDEEMAVAPLWGLSEGLTRAVAVQQRIYIETENRYFSTVLEQTPAAWSDCLRRAVGLVAGDLSQRCRAALQLYLLTVELLEVEDPVVAHTCGRIQAPLLARLRPDQQELYLPMRCDLWPDVDNSHAAEVAELVASNRPDYRCYLAEDPCSGEVFGLVELGLYRDRPPYGSGTTAFVDGLYVRPELRGRGLGEALLRAAIDELRCWHCDHIGSDTWAWHTQSRRLHQRCGFVVIEETEKEVGFLLAG